MAVKFLRLWIHILPNFYFSNYLYNEFFCCSSKSDNMIIVFCFCFCCCYYRLSDSAVVLHWKMALRTRLVHCTTSKWYNNSNKCSKMCWPSFNAWLSLGIACISSIRSYDRHKVFFVLPPFVGRRLECTRFVFVLAVLLWFQSCHLPSAAPCFYIFIVALLHGSNAMFIIRNILTGPVHNGRLQHV